MGYLRDSMIAAAALLLAGSPAFSQLSQQRIDEVRRQRMAERAQQRDRDQNADRDRAARARVTTAERMNRIIPTVNLQKMPARGAFQWWARRTGASLVINWQQMRRAGVDPQTPITLRLQTAPAEPVLRMIMQQASRGQTELIYETTRWYVRVMTRRAANQRTVLRLYDVRDLIMDVPNFTNAPDFDLRSALGSSAGSGSGAGTGVGGGDNQGGLFGDQQDDDERDEPGQSEKARANGLIDLIATTVEPTVWRRNGGQHASIRYFRGMLVVNAPRYVHRQIGIPVQYTQPGR